MTSYDLLNTDLNNDELLAAAYNDYMNDLESDYAVVEAIENMETV